MTQVVDVSFPRQHSQRLRAAFALSWLVSALAAPAAAAGLLVPAVYRETAWVVPQNRGQDLVTLLAPAVMLPVLRGTQRGSPRATLVWIGLLGYLAYTYTGAEFAHAFNLLFLVDVALFGATGAALIAGLAGIDATALRQAFDARAPRRGGIAFVPVKAATMGLALLAMKVFSLQAGWQVEPVLSAAWVSLATAGMARSCWFSALCRGVPGRAVRPDRPAAA
jgi:hypothetical protein